MLQIMTHYQHTIIILEISIYLSHTLRAKFVRNYRHSDGGTINKVAISYMYVIAMSWLLLNVCVKAGNKN